MPVDVHAQAIAVVREVELRREWEAITAYRAQRVAARAAAARAWRREHRAERWLDAMAQAAGWLGLGLVVCVLLAVILGLLVLAAMLLSWLIVAAS